MLKEIPRKNSPRVKEILENEELTIKEKSEQIYLFDFYMSGLETDGRFKMKYRPSDLEKLLSEVL